MAKKTGVTKGTKKSPAKKAAASKKATTKKSPAAAKKAATKKAPAAARTKAVKAVTDASAVLSDAIVKGMQEKKAKNITLLDLRGIQNRVSDFFVICDADSTTHVDAIAGSVEETVKKLTGEKPFHSEGWENSQWILMDYVNVVAHVFLREIREFYNIEGLWADAEIKEIGN